MTIRVKGLSWVGVGTDDYERTLHFFTQVLGLTVEDADNGQAILRVADGQIVEVRPAGDLSALVEPLARTPLETVPPAPYRLDLYCLSDQIDLYFILWLYFILV